MQDEQMSVVAVCPAAGLQVTLQLLVCGHIPSTGRCPSASFASGLQSAVGSIHSRSARASPCPPVWAVLLPFLRPLRKGGSLVVLRAPALAER